jgi:hypothetical protein
MSNDLWLFIFKSEALAGVVEHIYNPKTRNTGLHDDILPLKPKSESRQERIELQTAVLVEKIVVSHVFTILYCN